MAEEKISEMPVHTGSVDGFYVAGIYQGLNKRYNLSGILTEGLLAFVQSILTSTFWFSATGDEGNSIDISSLENKYIVSVQLNSFELEPTNSFPANDQYSYNATTGVFSFNQPFQSGDKLKIIYRAIV